MKGKKYDACFGSLYAINGLLPKEYRVRISDIEYNKKTALENQAECRHCNKLHNYSSLKFHDILLPLTVGIMINKEYERVWDCEECGKQNKLEETRIRNQIFEEPYFLKLIPKPPQRRNGLVDRITYHKQVARWVWTFIDELEAQMSNFRREYKPMSDEMVDSDLSMEESGESEDI